jgi:hypothetical protein
MRKRAASRSGGARSLRALVGGAQQRAGAASKGGKRYGLGPLWHKSCHLALVEGKDFKAHAQALQALRAWSLRLPERAAVVTDVDAVIEHHVRWTVERDALDDEINGSVIKLNDLKDRERLGTIAYHSRWAMAYKFEPRREVTEKGGHSDGERRDRPRAQ